MNDLPDLMFQNFQVDFGPKLQQFLTSNKFHYTNREALRCFLISMLTNIFEPPIAARNNLKTGYMASTENLIYFLTATDAETPTYNFFVIDLMENVADIGKTLFLEPRKPNLVAMLVDDEVLQFLPNKKLPKANVVKIYKAKTTYKVKI